PSKAEKNSRVNGLSAMYTLLAERHVCLEELTADKDGQMCDWIISENCPLLLAALPWATQDPDTVGDIEKTGSAVQLDVLDGARYAIYSDHMTMNAEPA